MMFVWIHKTPSRSSSPVVAAAAQSMAEPVKPDPDLYVVVVFGWFKSSSSVPCPCVVDFFGIFFILVLICWGF
ncbi:hypothetical protein Hanom_Chr12g01158671 [Helianthus anomalus]